jgi:drug/metabolite transporter (DMT)-like permease
MKKSSADKGGAKAPWWFVHAVIAAVIWGVWGALIDSTARAGFPAEMGYVVWAFTMVPPALFALRRAGWRLEHDRWAWWFGGLAGVLGAGGQLILFKLLRLAPAYLVFPIIALSPIVTVAMAFTILRERVAGKDWIGIVLALAAGVLLAYVPSEHGTVARGWLVLCSRWRRACCWRMCRRSTARWGAAGLC